MENKAVSKQDLTEMVTNIILSVPSGDTVRAKQAADAIIEQVTNWGK